MKTSRCVLALLLLAATGAVAQSAKQPKWVGIFRWTGSHVNCPNHERRIELMRLAGAGEADAAAELGIAYLADCAGKTTTHEGVLLLEQASKKNHARAQLVLGDVYRMGTDGVKDSLKEFEYYASAAEKGLAGGQNDLAICYAFGEGTPKDEAKAAELFSLAAAQSLTEAQFNYAVVLDSGRGVKRDYVLAKQWYMAVLQNSIHPPGYRALRADAEYRLGMMAEDGLGGPKDQAAANEWYRQAASHGSELAQLHLGVKIEMQPQTNEAGRIQFETGKEIFEGSEGLKKDEVQGFLLIDRAAQVGYTPAYNWLCWAQAEGRGTKKDLNKALEYCSQAVAAGVADAESYNRAAWMMVTSSDPQDRKDPQVMEYATKAVELSGWKTAYCIETLARATFELGNVEKAVELQKKALALAPESGPMRATLREYEKAKTGATGK